MQTAVSPFRAAKRLFQRSSARRLGCHLRPAHALNVRRFCIPQHHGYGKFTQIPTATKSEYKTSPLVQFATIMCYGIVGGCFLFCFRDFYNKKFAPPAFQPIFQNVNPLLEDVTNKCFLDIEVEGTKAGRIVIGLFGNVAPKTCENFRALCTGEKGISETSGKPLHYKGNRFHRIVGRFLCQAGDITENNGDGGESIYGPTFDDENHVLTCAGIGVLSMANRGRNTNSSQFFISTNPDNAHLNGKYVTFGRVVEGFRTLKTLESCGSPSGKPRARAIIGDCGELPLDYSLKDDPKHGYKLTDDPSKLRFSPGRGATVAPITS